MNIQSLVKSFTNLEIFLFVVFVIYLALPIKTPTNIAWMVVSPISMVIMFSITLYLFFYVNPILAILYIFVAYELLRRSDAPGGRVNMVEFTPTQYKKDAEMSKMNPPPADLLEVDVISKMAPIGHSDPIQILSSSYKPTADPIGEASPY